MQIYNKRSKQLSNYPVKVNISSIKTFCVENTVKFAITLDSILFVNQTITFISEDRKDIPINSLLEIFSAVLYEYSDISTLSVYFHSSMEHNFILNTESVFSSTFQLDGEMELSTINSQVVKEICAFIYLQVFITSQFKLGHIKIGEHYQNESIIIIENINRLTLKWLETKSNDSLFLDYDYRVQPLTGIFSMESNNSRGQFFFLLMVAYKFHLESLAINPLTSNYNPEHGKTILKHVMRSTGSTQEDTTTPDCS